MEQNASRVVVRNSLFSAGRLLVTTLVVFWVTPFALQVLGPVQFGIWALTGVLTTYTSLGDFGMSRALIKFVAELDARDEIGKINRMVSSALVIFSAWALLGWAVFIAAREFIVINLFRIPATLHDDAMFVFVGVVSIALLDLISGMFSSILDGLQRMEITNTMNAIARVMSALGVFFVLNQGWGLRGLVVKNAVVSMAMLLASTHLAHRVLPGLRVRPWLFSKQTAREIFGFSVNIQVVNLVVLIIDPLNKTLVSNFVGLQYVTYYDIASRIISQLISLFQALASSIYPAVSALQVRRGPSAVTWLYLRATRYLTLLALPVFTAVIILARPFLQLWLGDGYEPSVLTLQVLTAGWLVSMMATPGYFIAQGIGRPELSTTSSVVAGLVSLLIGFLAISTVGYFGLVVGNALGIAAGSVLMFILLRRAVAASAREVLQAILNRAWLINVLLAASTIWLLQWAAPASLLAVLAIGAGYAALYGVGFTGSGGLDSDDHRLLRQLAVALLEQRFLKPGGIP
jgi:O-antigen/teichoic acid export membrane protein